MMTAAQCHKSQPQFKDENIHIITSIFKDMKPIFYKRIISETEHSEDNFTRPLNWCHPFVLTERKGRQQEIKAMGRESLDTSDRVNGFSTQPGLPAEWEEGTKLKCTRRMDCLHILLENLNPRFWIFRLADYINMLPCSYYCLNDWIYTRHWVV